MSSPNVTMATGSPLVTLTTTAETVALSSGVLPVNAPGAQGVYVQGTCTGLTGAAAATIQVRVRKGTATSGTLVGGVMEEVIGASSNYSIDFHVLDASPAAAAQYSVTLQQTSATGNGTCTLATIALQVANASGQ